MITKEEVTLALKEKCYKKFSTKGIFRLDNVSRLRCFDDNNYSYVINIYQYDIKEFNNFIDFITYIFLYFNHEGGVNYSDCNFHQNFNCGMLLNLWYKYYDDNNDDNDIIDIKENPSKEYLDNIFAKYIKSVTSRLPDMIPSISIYIRYDKYDEIFILLKYDTYYILIVGRKAEDEDYYT